MGKIFGYNGVEELFVQVDVIFNVRIGEYGESSGGVVLGVVVYEDVFEVDVEFVSGEFFCESFGVFDLVEYERGIVCVDL